MELLTQLDSFRNTEHFAKFGFSQGGNHYEWIKQAERLSRSKNQKAAAKAKHLYSLGVAYVISKGKETEHTIKLRRKIKSL